MIDDSNKEYDYESVAYVEKEIAVRLVKLLKFSDIPEADIVYDPINESYEVQVDRSHYQKASELVRIFKENEFDANYDEVPDETDASGSDSQENYEDSKETAAYVKAKDRYKDNISSAYTFMICGVCGLILLLLQDLGVVKLLRISGISNILFNIVVGGLFAVFVGVGIHSYKYAGVLKQQAETEEHFTEELMEWLRDNLTEEVIEQAYDGNIPDEMKYFRRIDIIKNILLKNYNTLDESFLEKIADDYYEEIFSA